MDPLLPVEYAAARVSSDATPITKYLNPCAKDSSAERSNAMSVAVVLDVYPLASKVTRQQSGAQRYGDARPYLDV